MTQLATHTARGAAWPQEDTRADQYERLYNMLLANIPCSVLLVDSHLRVVSANQNFLMKARVTESNVIGRQLQDVFPAGICQHLRLHERISAVFRTGTPVKGEQMVYRAPGLSMRTYYYSLIPVRQDDTIGYVMLLMEDVTEQIRLGQEVRQAERHLASVVESASDMVVSTDISGRVLTWNSAAEKVTGYPESEVRHRYLYELATGAQRAALGGALDKAPREGRTGPVEIELASRPGNPVLISWVLSPMRDTNGRVVALVAVGRDLTERRKLEAKLLQSDKLAALGVMAGGIAHEVRNPLAVISSAAQLLVEKNLTAEVQRECAQSIFRATRKASSIIEGLLRFARSSGRGVMEPLDLASIVDEALALVANQLRLGRIRLLWQTPGSPVWVQGTAVLLQQLVTNLVLNAVNAMADRAGTLRVSLAQAEDQIVLEVEDTGKGISRADLPKVLDPFFTTMPIGKGTGLGLSISYAIVQEHEGKIDIASREGAGTTVTVVLPRGRPGAAS
ncbi:MAG: PAS domain-containing protein [Planctomycetota bacterium]